jgi:hypothetical protein
MPPMFTPYPRTEHTKTIPCLHPSQSWREEIPTTKALLHFATHRHFSNRKVVKRHDCIDCRVSEIGRQMMITQFLIRIRICLSSPGLTSLLERLADGEPLSLTKLSAEKRQLFGPVGSIPLSSKAVAWTPRSDVGQWSDQ